MGALSSSTEKCCPCNLSNLPGYSPLEPVVGMYLYFKGKNSTPNKTKQNKKNEKRKRKMGTGSKQ